MENGRKEIWISDLVGKAKDEMGYISLLGIDKVFVEGDTLYLSLEITERHLNALGCVHGGLMYTLCDQAVGAYDIYIGRKAVGMDVNMHYYSAGQKGDVLTAIVHTRKLGRKTGVHWVELKNQNEKLLADATITSFYFD